MKLEYAKKSPIKVSATISQLVSQSIICIEYARKGRSKKERKKKHTVDSLAVRKLI